MMKYLILGANGLIGRQFVKLCKGKGIEYVGTCYSRGESDLIPFDQLDFEKIPALFSDVAPDVIVNAIGLAGGVDFCQENPGVGRKYHVDAVKIMADWSAAHGAAYAYISTDYVFNGENPPYKEMDETGPLNLYGELKLEAEQYISERLGRYVIARTTNVFGWDPLTRTSNFLMHLIGTLQTQDCIAVPSFLYGNPTYVGDLAAGIFDLLENRHYGLYHIVGPGYINRYDWAVKCISMAGIGGKTIEKLETPPPGMVSRPFWSHLDTAKFRKVSSVVMKDIDQGLEKFVEEMKAKN